MGEPLGSVIDNLNRAARLGLLAHTSDAWVAARALRNCIVHEYIRNLELLVVSVTDAHAAVSMLLDFVERCRAYARERGLVE